MREVYPGWELRNQDRQRLAQCFHAAFDRSLAEAVLQGKGTLPKATYIGGGRHFDVYRLRGNEDFSLVAKCMRNSNGNDKYSLWVRSWLKHIRLLEGRDVPLLPPFKLIEAKNLVGLVMPYANEPLNAAATHWQPLQIFIADFHEGLQKHGLKLADMLQAGAWRGIPFVYDLSDLMLLS